MIARLRQFASDLAETFWLIPGLMVMAGILAAGWLVALDRQGLPDGLAERLSLYDGGATGARSLLGAVVASTIGVAGTVFSITVAALSLAAGQMGPRLLRNFTRDRGNQLTLGAFLGTFAYGLIVLRSVRTPDEGGFVPQLALTVAILLAIACVLILVFFVGHMASRINVDTVIELVGEDLRAAVERLTLERPAPPVPPEAYWRDAAVVVDPRRGYLQQLDEDGLADWAAAHGTAIRLLVRPGHYVFPGGPIAEVIPPQPEAAEAIRNATALGPRRVAATDPEFAVRQLVEVAVRALSPGINDPLTAISVLDRLGATLCDLAGRHLRTGVALRGGRPVLVAPPIDYDGLTDSMFHMIRQNAARAPAVLIRILEVLAVTAQCERDPARRATLRRHADLVLGDAERTVVNRADLADVRDRHAAVGTAADGRR